MLTKTGLKSESQHQKNEFNVGNGAGRIAVPHPAESGVGGAQALMIRGGLPMGAGVGSDCGGWQAAPGQGNWATAPRQHRQHIAICSNLKGAVHVVGCGGTGIPWVSMACIDGPRMARVGGPR